MIEAPVRPAVEPVAVRLQQAIAAYRLGDLEAAEALYAGVLADDPGNPHALHLLGLIVHQRGDLEMAEHLIARSVQLAPHSRAHHNLGVIQQRQGKHGAALCTYRAAITLEPDYVEAAANLIFTLDLHPYATPDLLLAERLAFARAFCDPLTASAPPHPNDRDPNRRLRVGYVSADFKHHSAAMSFKAALLGHDPAEVEVVLYSTAPSHDDESAAFRDRADIWCEVADQTPDELAAIIRSDQIDVLVDLSGYSQGHRLLTFARKPAPVQITGWGYATGTGLAAMDYLMADAVAVPPSHADRYRERILRLPCLLSYSPQAFPEVGLPPSARNGYRTYGYLGRAMKLNEPTLAAWAAILRRDGSSRLLLKSGEYLDRGMRDRIAHTLVGLGVSPERIEVRGSTTRFDHLAAYNDVDVALDPFPHGGGMTVLDAALMGVPTVTLLGETIPGRTAASILTALGYTEWIAAGRDEYVARAGQGCSCRERLRASLLGSALCDPSRYARSVEAAYRRAWQRWCREDTA